MIRPDWIQKGSTVLVLDPRNKEEEVTLELRDQKGKAGVIYLKVTYQQQSPDEMKNTTDAHYGLHDSLNSVKSMLKDYQTQSVGQAKAQYGFRPKYPIMIIPGLASSALEAWESPKESWIRDRVWVDPFKIGKTAMAQKLTTRMTKKSSSKPSSSRKLRSSSKQKSSLAQSSFETLDISATEDDGGEESLNADQRTWLRHILTAPDGFSDPPGIKLRPVTGLGAVDYLATHPLARKASYVFGHVIHELAMVGYTPRNLDAAPVSVSLNLRLNRSLISKNVV